MALRSEEELLERLRSGRLIEGVETATEAYLEGLKRTLIVSADTELISAPAYLRAARDGQFDFHGRMTRGSEGAGLRDSRSPGGGLYPGRCR